MVICSLVNSYYSMQKNNFFYKQYCRANENYSDIITDCNNKNWLLNKIFAIFWYRTINNIY